MRLCLILCVLLLSFLHLPTALSAKSYFRILVVLSNYRNPNDRGSNGNRCESFLRHIATSKCDPYFAIRLNSGTNSQSRRSGRWKNRKYITHEFMKATFLVKEDVSQHANARNVVVDIYDDDRFRDDHIATISVPYHLRNNFFVRTIKTGHKHASITVKIKVTCQNGFYGDNCNLTKQPLSKKQKLETTSAETKTEANKSARLAITTSKEILPKKYSTVVSGSSTQLALLLAVTSIAIIVTVSVILFSQRRRRQSLKKAQENKSPNENKSQECHNNETYDLSFEGAVDDVDRDVTMQVHGYDNSIYHVQMLYSVNVNPETDNIYEIP